MTVRHSNRAGSVFLPDTAIFITVGWILMALLLSPFFKIHWLAGGDFKYSSAMYYHGIMVPVLILSYLLTKELLPLKYVHTRLYMVTAILAVFLVGVGSIFHNSEGVSPIAVIQIIGMVLTDFLGIMLLAAMLIFAFREKRKTDPPFWLLFFSIVAILIAAPLGHLAGWCIDLGTGSIPWLKNILNAANLKGNEFKEGLVTSHSHLIVAALMSGLAALAAIYFQFQSRIGWRKLIGDVAIWMLLISLVSATIIYILSVLIGWEPPAIFASGPDGIPLDDVVLGILEAGFLVLMAGLSGSREKTSATSVYPVRNKIRLLIFLNWIFGFVAAVLTGYFIELNEKFYGSAPGTLNDQIFIRAHLLYPFLLLPVLFTVSLAIGIKYDNAKTVPVWTGFFIWVALFGMTLGLVGEILWFTILSDVIFLAAIFMMVLSLIPGMLSLWPNKDQKGMDHVV